MVWSITKGCPAFRSLHLGRVGPGHPCPLRAFNGVVTKFSFATRPRLFLALTVRSTPRRFQSALSQNSEAGLENRKLRGDDAMTVRTVQEGQTIRMVGIDRKSRR